MGDLYQSGYIPIIYKNFEPERQLHSLRYYIFKIILRYLQMLKYLFKFINILFILIHFSSYFHVFTYSLK